MHARDRMAATQKDVELGHFAFLTPPPPKRRRPADEAPAQPRRPDWADATEESARKDLGAIEKEDGLPGVLQPRGDAPRSRRADIEEP